MIVITKPEIKTADKFVRVHATSSGHDVWATWNRELLGPNTFRSAITVAVSDVIATVAGELGPSASVESSHPSSRSLAEPTNATADCHRTHLVEGLYQREMMLPRIYSGAPRTSSRHVFWDQIGCGRIACNAFRAVKDKRGNRILLSLSTSEVRGLKVAV